MTLAVFDQEAFYPFRRLVQGPLNDVGDLAPIERFLRAAVLHDDIYMEPEPVPGVDDESMWSEEDLSRGVRAVIVSFAPTLDTYGPLLFNFPDERPNANDVDLSPRLTALAAEYALGGPADPYYEAHIDYLSRLTSIVKAGGSVICDGDLVRAAFEHQMAFPESLFEGLDADWESYARDAYHGFEFSIPPVLSIVLTRTARRDAIPTIVNDLRAEWSDARKKIWALVEAEKTVRTLQERHDIRAEFQEASELFAPTSEFKLQSPMRILWDIFMASDAGGNPLGVVGKLVSIAVNNSSGGQQFLGVGAFDLARRVRANLKQVERMAELLPRVLLPSEIDQLSRSVPREPSPDISPLSIEEAKELMEAVAGKEFLGEIKHSRLADIRKKNQSSKLDGS